MRYGIILIVLLLMGCETGPEAPVVTDPPPGSDVTWAGKKGTARVDGELVITTHSFGTRPGSGQEVSLIPHDKATQALMTEHFGKSGFNSAEYPWAKLPGKVRAARRRTRANRAGKFTFRSVPAGTWVALGCVRWQTPGHYIPEGGCMIHYFSVNAGERVRISLSQ